MFIKVEDGYDVQIKNEGAPGKTIHSLLGFAVYSCESEGAEIIILPVISWAGNKEDYEIVQAGKHVFQEIDDLLHS